MAIHSTPYLSTREITVFQFNDVENINPIISNNSTTVTTNIHSSTYTTSTTDNTTSHPNLSTTESSPTFDSTISHSNTSSQTRSLGSYKDKIKNIVELLKKLRKIQKTLADKSKGQLSPMLISRIKAVLKQIVAGNIDSVNGDSTELEILLSTTVNPNEDTTDLTMEKLLKLFDDFERMYNVLLDDSIQSTTQSTTQNNTIFSTTYSTIFSTTQSISTTSPTQYALTSSTPNTSTTSHSSTPSSINNLRSDESNNHQPIVDAIQQLKMALYHDFYAFKKSQEERYFYIAHIYKNSL